jgi:urease accessory protein UreF
VRATLRRWTPLDWLQLGTAGAVAVTLALLAGAMLTESTRALVGFLISWAASLILVGLLAYKLGRRPR